jgi:oligopeptide transport system permease protein
MLEVLGQDYIRTAYAKGLNERRVVLRHALRGALIPVASYLGPAVAGILTGSLVLERVFALPGMGSHFIEAAIQRDYTLAMGMVLIYTALLLVMNTVVDLSYAMLDPRVKLEEQ